MVKPKFSEREGGHSQTLQTPTSLLVFLFLFFTSSQAAQSFEGLKGQVFPLINPASSCSN
jgi:hypothetical protein